MSANVETMFSLREKPWHGLGRIIENAPNSEEALIAAGLDWKVVSRPVVVNGCPVENYMANVRDRDNSVLGIVSPQYKIVQNDEAFVFTDSLIGDGSIQYETAGSLAEGRRIWMLAQLPEIQIIGDTVNPYLVFMNSHDGRGGIRVAVTPIRVVCQNTLNLALTQSHRSWTTVHMGNLHEKMEEAKRTLFLAENYIKELSETANFLANKMTLTAQDAEELIQTLIPIPDKTLPRQKENLLAQQTELAYRYFHAPDLKGLQGTGWGFINAVSDLATHGEPRRKTKTFQERLFNKTVNGHPLIDKAYSLLRGA